MRSRASLALLGILFYLSCLAFLGWLAFQVVDSHLYLQGGVSYGEPPEINLASVYPLGVNASLEQYQEEEELRRALEMAREGGFLWIRQHFPWADMEPERGVYAWEKWDRMVALAKKYGLTIIAVLDTSPPWAREPGDGRYAPPRHFADYYEFVAAFAHRYEEQIDYYEVWDEPNIYPHWGERYVQPISYVQLLRGAYQAIKEADPGAAVLSAGLAPNVEPGGRNMSDLLFLQEMYEAGAKDCFDILAIKPYGFWTGPEDRRLDPGVTNFSRAALLREEMVRNGDGAKAAWAVEWGWNALPAEWSGRPSPWGTDRQEVQTQRTMEALERALEEWPWMGAMALTHLQPYAPPDDPIHGFALLDQDLSPRLTYQKVKEWAEGGVPLYPGRYGAENWATQYEGSWSREGGALVGANQGGSLTFAFKGNRLDMLFLPPFHGEARVDGGPALTIEVEGSGERRVTVASGLSQGVHTLRLVANRASRGGVKAFMVRREADFRAFYLSLLLLAGTAVLISWRLTRLLLLPPSRRLWRGVAAAYLGRPEWQQIGLLAAALGFYYFLPGTPLSLLALTVVAALVYLRLDLGLAFTALTIPFFLQPKPLLGKAFSLVETLTLLCFAAWFLKAVISGGEIFNPRRYRKDSSFEMQEMPWRVWVWRELPPFIKDWAIQTWRSLNGMDLALLFLVVLGLFSLTISENLGVSARELRVIILEPALFYLLLREIPGNKGQLWRIVDGLILAALILSLYGLYQYLFTSEVIVAEGVRRIRGVYGSPNNLSLFLGRIVPILLAMAFFGTGRRRLLYGLASLPVMVCLFLTYSRGAWLLGLPAAILFLGAVKGRRALGAALAAVVAGVLALLPLAGLERLTSLFDLQGGTTFRRLKLWEATLHMIRDHPLFGVGLDNFLYQYPRYMLPEAWQEPDLSHPHNLIFDWWTRLGVLGVVALLWLEVAFFKVGWRLYRQLREADLQVLALGLMASMVDFLAHGLVDHSFFLVDLAFVFCLTLGVMRRMERL